MAFSIGDRVRITQPDAKLYNSCGVVKQARDIKSLVQFDNLFSRWFLNSSLAYADDEHETRFNDEQQDYKFILIDDIVSVFSSESEMMCFIESEMEGVEFSDVENALNQYTVYKAKDVKEYKIDLNLKFDLNKR